MGIEALDFQKQLVVWAGGSMSSAFEVNMGVKQGYPASPHVFCLFLNKAQDFTAAHISPSWHAYTLFLALLMTFILLYADDLVLIASFAEQLQ